MIIARTSRSFSCIFYEVIFALRAVLSPQTQKLSGVRLLALMSYIHQHTANAQGPFPSSFPTTAVCWMQCGQIAARASDSRNGASE